MSTRLADRIELPCGAALANRLAKAAMSEGLADAANNPTAELDRLYRRWADSGAGLLFTGNIQVDRLHLERPGNIVLDAHCDLTALQRLTQSGRAGGAHFWAQLSHTGRQVDAAINPAPLSASDVEIATDPRIGRSFARPRPMSADDIARTIGQFADAATLAKRAGFTGVAIHAAHGYLISQFLSPRTNLRQDAWGGSLRNRARLLLEVFEAVRAAVGPDFPVGIKLNASDFQRGGFTNAECIDVVGMLNALSVDLLELSGGSLEQPKVVGITVGDQGEDGVRESTRKREAFFVDFAGAVRAAAAMPVMVTGGFRSKAAMIEAVERGDLDIVGIGRPLIVQLDGPRRLLEGAVEVLSAPEALVPPLVLMPWLNVQIDRLGAGDAPDMALDPGEAVARFREREAGTIAALRQRRALAAA